MKELMLIQSELKAPKSQTNKFGGYQYRSCEDILEAVKPLLAKHECVLTISDEIKEAGNLTYVEATASIRPSADSAPVVSVTAQAGIDPNRKGMDIAQSFGSSSSYARKYALNGLFCIDDTKDADATNTHDKTPSKPAKKAAKKPEPITDDQKMEIAALMLELSITDAQFEKTMGAKILNLSDFAAHEAIERLTKLKNKKG